MVKDKKKKQLKEEKQQIPLIKNPDYEENIEPTATVINLNETSRYSQKSHIYTMLTIAVLDYPNTFVNNNNNKQFDHKTVTIYDTIYACKTVSGAIHRIKLTSKSKVYNREGFQYKLLGFLVALGNRPCGEHCYVETIRNSQILSEFNSFESIDAQMMYIKNKTNLVMYECLHCKIFDSITYVIPEIIDTTDEGYQKHLERRSKEIIQQIKAHHLARFNHDLDAVNDDNQNSYIYIIRRDAVGNGNYSVVFFETNSEDLFEDIEKNCKPQKNENLSLHTIDNYERVFNPQFNEYQKKQIIKKLEELDKTFKDIQKN